ncbi:pilus assembly protein PilP [Thiohalorhabdus methylotrophus]|uniref:Pilus assembly protein PilP n=1 Tax=Thiohalorhabdus methylotrophus TaxID=3242694 RepID=A0ABV4TPP5_9GAMM
MSVPRTHMAVAGLAVLLAGCGNGQQDPVADLRALVERPAPPPDEDATQPLPEPVKTGEVTFRVLDRSPFQPLPALEDTKNQKAYQGPRPDKDRPREPLEQFALGSLRIVGTMQRGEKGWRAYVRAPDGIVYTVQTGDHMGQQYGQVQKIGASSVTVRELVPRGQGRWEPRERTVEIKSTGG